MPGGPGQAGVVGLARPRPRASRSSRRQRSAFEAEEVAGRDLAHRHPQGRDLARQELHVSVGPRVGLAVLLGQNPVADFLTVLGEQDQRSGVRRLQAEDQRQEDERVGVEAEVVRGQRVPADPEHDEDRHPHQEPSGAHEARELLGEDAERVVVVRRGAQQRTALLLGGGVETAAPAAADAQPWLTSGGVAERSGWSRQFSGSRWSRRSSTVTAPSRRPASSTTGAATRL